VKEYRTAEREEIRLKRQPGQERPRLLRASRHQAPVRNPHPRYQPNAPQVPRRSHTYISVSLSLSPPPLSRPLSLVQSPFTHRPFGTRFPWGSIPQQPEGLMVLERGPGTHTRRAHTHTHTLLDLTVLNRIPRNLCSSLLGWCKNASSPTTPPLCKLAEPTT
jgi:hypothetical protein